MTEKEFLNAVSNGKADIVQVLLDGLAELGARYCLIGGLAVNAYADPVVSLDLDLVVAADDLHDLQSSLGPRFKIATFPHRVNLTSDQSDLRIQLQTDPRYQEFLDRAVEKTVLGYEMQVAAPSDLIDGKVWAYLDETRRKSKRHKDLADIARLVERFPLLEERLPAAVKQRIE